MDDTRQNQIKVAVMAGMLLAIGYMVYQHQISQSETAKVAEEKVEAKKVQEQSKLMPNRHSEGQSKKPVAAPKEKAQKQKEPTKQNIEQNQDQARPEPVKQALQLELNKISAEQAELNKHHTEADSQVEEIKLDVIKKENKRKDLLSDGGSQKDEKDMQISTVKSQNSSTEPESSQKVEFQGLEVFVTDDNARTELPNKQEEKPVPIFEIIRKFIGQDIMRVSLPVCLNEPFCHLQRMCESTNTGLMLVKKAVEEPDSVRRTALCMVASIAEYYSTKFRKKKPFNPMLGETFEMVTEEYRFLAEKVQHTPEQICAYSFECDEASMTGYYQQYNQFSFNWGSGKMEFWEPGTFDLHLKRTDEYLTCSKPLVQAKNIIFGGLFVDLSGKTETINHKTGEKVVVEFFEKQGNVGSHLKGFAYDRNGKEAIEITGSWATAIQFKDLRTNITETVFEELPLTKEAHLQYYVSDFSLRLHQKTANMQGVVAPTDSRWREDVSLHERGMLDESDLAKIQIEEEQRRKRRSMEKAKETWKPQFFELVPHPHIKQASESRYGKFPPVTWRLLDGQQSYWERRKRGDWQTMPNLFQFGDK